MTVSGSPALASRAQASSTLAASWFAWALPPRRIRWQSGLPAVRKIAERPALVTERKLCGWRAAPIASTAICTEPAVPFLNPTGQESPEASSRWPWLSVVLAPIAPQPTRSATYCGLIRSRYSTPAGTPARAMSSSSERAVASPSLMRKLPSMRGSLISPFQPTVVRGFSK